VLTGSFRELPGERDPALQQVARLRVGDQRGQVVRPQGKIAPRQFVGIAHARDYNATARNRCIVA
jgi:hypothetical protein